MKNLIKILAIIAVVDCHPLKEKFEQRIVGGVDAEKGAAPFIVSLSNGWFDQEIYLDCGGTILNEWFVLTAAHCVDDLPIKYFKVTAGQHDLSQFNGEEQARHVEKIFIHEKYNGGSSPSHDIALLKMTEPFEIIEDLVEAAILPTAFSSVSGSAQLFGWGAISAGDIMQFTGMLQTVEKPILPTILCRELMGHMYPHLTLHKTNFCTGPLTGGISACFGDSGSPLVQKDESGMAKIVGIVSWIPKMPCGSVVAPTVYTQVSQFIGWINEIMTNEAQETTTMESSSTEGVTETTEQSTDVPSTESSEIPDTSSPPPTEQSTEAPSTDESSTDGVSESSSTEGSYETSTDANPDTSSPHPTEQSTESPSTDESSSTEVIPDTTEKPFETSTQEPLTVTEENSTEGNTDEIENSSTTIEEVETTSENVEETTSEDPEITETPEPENTTSDELETTITEDPEITETETTDESSEGSSSESPQTSTDSSEEIDLF